MWQVIYLGLCNQYTIISKNNLYVYLFRFLLKDTPNKLSYTGSNNEIYLKEKT
jgi:hypothetical protein